MELSNQYLNVPLGFTHISAFEDKIQQYCTNYAHNQETAITLFDLELHLCLSVLYQQSICDTKYEH